VVVGVLASGRRWPDEDIIPKTADVATSNMFGPNLLKGFKVWAEEKS
jgi:hypothetical protein